MQTKNQKIDREKVTNMMNNEEKQLIVQPVYHQWISQDRRLYRTFFDPTKVDREIWYPREMKAVEMYDLKIEQITSKSSYQSVIIEPKNNKQKTVKVKITININSWKDAINYDEKQSLTVLKNLINAVGLKPEEYNIKWLREELIRTVQNYENKYQVTLSDSMRNRLSIALAKMTYDRLYARG